MSISLKVGEIDPPSIITDIINLPDPVKLGITITAYNYDAVGLYFKIDGYNAAWTCSTVNLGLIGAGGNLQQNLDQFGSRARPAAETAETLTLRLRAYTDAGYTILKWTYTKTLDVLFIKSNDGSWTQDVLNNFDDGTVQGWAALMEVSPPPTVTLSLAVATDYLLSPPYSLKMVMQEADFWGAIQARARLYKSFTTPDRDTVLAIFDVRLSNAQPGGTVARSKYVEVQRDSTVLLHIGKSYDLTGTNYVPLDRWLRIIAALPRNTAIDLRFIIDYWMETVGTDNPEARLWLDDFRIISK